MGTIFTILEVVDRLKKTTQNNKTIENTTFREILDEEMKELNKDNLKIKASNEV